MASAIVEGFSTSQGSRTGSYPITDGYSGIVFACAARAAAVYPRFTNPHSLRSTNRHSHSRALHLHFGLYRDADWSGKTNGQLGLVQQFAAKLAAGVGEQDVGFNVCLRATADTSQPHSNAGVDCGVSMGAGQYRFANCYVVRVVVRRHGCLFGHRRSDLS